MTGNIDDVVDEDDKFQVSMKCQSKMQGRHNLMMNIQHLGKIIVDLENGINRWAAVLKSMEVAKEQPHYRILGEFMIPVTDTDAAMVEIEASMERFDGDLKKHRAEVKSMQLQHDGLSKEIDVLLELEKGAYKVGQTQMQKAKDKLKRKGRRK